MSQESLDINKELADNGVKENAFLELEQNYHQLLNEISTDSSLDRFREELEKFIITFKVAAGNEKILIKLYKELKKKYQDDQQKMNKVVEQAKEDRKEYETLMKRVNMLQKDNLQIKEEARSKELAAKFEMSQLSTDKKKEETENDENIELLGREIEKLRRQLDQLNITNDKLEKELNETVLHKDRLESQMKEIKEDNIVVKESNNKLAKNIEISNKKLQEKDVEVSKLQEVNNIHLKDVNDIKAEKDSLLERNKKLEFDILEKKTQIEQLTIEKINLEKANKNIKQDITIIREDLEDYKRRDKQNKTNIKNLDKDKDKLDQEIKKNILDLRESKREIDRTIKENSNLSEEINLYKNEIRILKLEIEKMKKNIENEEKKIQEKTLENRHKEKELLKKENQVLTLINEKAEAEGDNVKKKESLNKLKVQLDQAIRTNAELEVTRDKITEENTKLKNKIDHLLEDIRLRENRIQELQKKVTETEKKMKLQREVYDAVRKDKNLYFQNLIDTQDRLNDRENALKDNKKEIENLKSEIKKKDENIVNLKNEISNLSDEIKAKSTENKSKRAEADILRENVLSLEKEIEKLKLMVEDTAKDNRKLKEEYKLTIINRDSLSSQLIRRNDEVSLLHEKIMVLTTNLSMREKDFQKIKEEINHYIRENRNLTREIKICHNYKDQSNKYAKEIINLNKELLREKNLNKALTEEVESSDMFRDRPFHRWRKNEGIDPDALEMQYKINLLQKRLISKTEECVEKEITVQEMTNEIQNLKKLANKKPTFEIEKSIQLYKQELQKNSEKMKSIIAERNLFENITEDLKAENNSLKREKDEIQMKYHEVRTKFNRLITNRE